MGMAPTAGKCVAASTTSVPAGVMGRPSAAGSCWHLAPLEKAKLVTRKTTILNRDFIGLVSPILEMIVITILGSIKIGMPESREELFRKFYSPPMADLPVPMATYLTRGASTPRMKQEPSLISDKLPTSHP